MSKTLDAINMSNQRDFLTINVLVVKAFPIGTTSNGKKYRSFQVIDSTMTDSPVNVKAWDLAANCSLIEPGKTMLLNCSVNIYQGRKSLNMNKDPLPVKDSHGAELDTLWDSVKNKYQFMQSVKPATSLYDVMDRVNFVPRCSIIDLYAVVKDCHDSSVTKNDKLMRRLHLIDNTDSIVTATIFGEDASNSFQIGEIIQIKNGAVNEYNDNRNININSIAVVSTTPSDTFNKWYIQNYAQFKQNDADLTVYQALTYDLRKNPVVTMNNVVVASCDDDKSIDQNNKWKRSLEITDKSVSDSKLKVTIGGDNADSEFSEGDVVKIKRMKIYKDNTDTNCAWMSDEPPVIVKDDDLSDWWKQRSLTQPSKAITTYGFDANVDNLPSMTTGCRIHLKDVKVKNMGEFTLLIGDERRVEVKLPEGVEPFNYVVAEIRSATVTGPNGLVTVNEASDFIVRNL